MRVVITGGTGFIGRELSRVLVSRGYNVIALTRSSRPSEIAGVRHVVWDGRTSSGWAEYADGAVAIVNLAGENIAAGRWSSSKKQQIEQSRLDAGRAVCEAVAKAAEKPEVVIQASAVGYYGPRGAEPVNEYSVPGDSFLAGVAVKWEDSTSKVEELGVRRVVVRTGMVLGHGGALAKMTGPFKLGLGSYLGEGHQGVSWIHIDDEVRALLHLLENRICRGPYNLSSINPVTSSRFTNTLARVMKRKVRLRIPAFVLRLALGQMAEEVLLSGQFVLPERLITSGFSFQYLDVGDALMSLLDV